MKLWEIFRFEFAYQAHRIRTWIYFVAFFVIAFLLTNNAIEDARNGGAFANSPSVIAFVTSLCNLLWVLVATAVAGNSAARDAETRMYPLVYTSPISKVEYLGGRFLAALTLNALILLMVQVGMLLAVLKPGVGPEVLGPFRPSAYISSYIFIALSTAFITTAIQFSLAILKRRAVTSYLGGLLLCLLSFVAGAVGNLLHLPTLGKVLDPIHYVSNGLISKALTPIEKNTRLIGLDPSILLNGLLWVAIAIGILVFTRLRFHFGHYSGSDRKVEHVDNISPEVPVRIVRPHVAFGFIVNLRQAGAIAWTSFEALIKGGAGLVLIVPISILIGLLMPLAMDVGGVALLPTTANVLTTITAPIADNLRFPWMLIPLIIIFYAGEVVWRERDAGLNEIAFTTPVPEWCNLLGKFMGLSLVLITWIIFLIAAGMLGQIRMGYFDFEIGVYLQVLLGIQLIDWLLFAALVFAVHVVVNHKQAGYLLSLVAYGFIVFASRLGIEHKLLIYTSDPGWRYSDMRAFATTVGPWLWFKTYWISWALLFAVGVKLLWVRGVEDNFKSRLREARRRLTHSTAAVGMTAIVLIITVGGYIFFNTNVRNAYETTADRLNRRAQYELSYGKYKDTVQPVLMSTSLRIDIYPERPDANIHGTYILTNTGSVEIDSIHVSIAHGVETTIMSFDRRATPVLTDPDIGYRIYSLEDALVPGDSLRLTFDVHIEAKGFRNDFDALVASNGTYFTNQECFPAIGYQRNRELNVPEERKQYGLIARPDATSPGDSVATRTRLGGEPITFEATVSTSADQVAVAPGALRRTWTEGDRRYFHYVSDAPINNEYDVFSARYALHEEQWIPSMDTGRAVAIQMFHDRRHAGNLARMVRSVRASLAYHTARYGPYQHNYIRLIEHPALGMGVRTEAATIEYGERFSSLNPGNDPREQYLVFAVLAHAVARDWWGMQVVPADVAGAGLLTTSLETYSGMRVVEDTLGSDVLQQYIGSMREAYIAPRTRATPPLFRATSSFAFSRKGPFALYAMGEYIGKDRVDDALHHLFEKFRSGKPPLATSLDLYRELQAVTPDSLQYLLEDLFMKNTFWEFETDQVIARSTEDGIWQVTLDIRVRKVVVDEAGVETEQPVNDWVEIGVFGEAESYVEKHLLRSGAQTVTLTVTQKPDRAGIDPRHLLSELGEIDTNVKTAKIED
jgi:ABC-2 type transport system permease protein